MTHGGKREGAGRKPTVSPRLKKIPYNTKLPTWLVEWIRKQDESGAVLIEQALVEAHNMRRPKK